MAPKRKSDAMAELLQGDLATGIDSASGKDGSKVLDPPAKKARVAKKPASTKKDQDKPSQSWKDIKLPGEDDEDERVPVYDDCAEVRRKIRLLQKTPGWKVTPWLREIGNINNNSYSRFMKETGKTDGAANGTYYAAYIYFEKVRILEEKKKTPTRLSNEKTHPKGFPLENSRAVWVFNP